MSAIIIGDWTVGSEVIVPAGNPFILAQTLGTPRSDFNGCVGFFFTVGGSNITVTELGRWKIAGNGASHTLKITDASANILASTSVNMATGSAGSYVYVSITPLELTSGINYGLLSSEISGGDQFYSDDTTPTSLASFATLISSIYQDACTGSLSQNLASKTYVPVNFKIQ